MPWRRASVVVEGAAAEALAEALEARGAVATELADADAGTPDEDAIFAEPGADAAVWSRCAVVALFPPRADAPALLAPLGAALVVAGSTISSCA